MSTVLLCVVVIGLCVAAISVETLSSAGHQPATTHPERRSAWEPWRSIARRWGAHAIALWVAIRRVAGRFDRRMAAAGTALQHRAARFARATGHGAIAVTRRATVVARRSGAALGSLVRQASAAARSGVRRGGDGVARAARGAGRVVVAALAAIALAVLNVGAAIGSGAWRARRRLRTAGIAVSSFVARGLDRLDDGRTRRADRRAIRAAGGQAPPGSVSIAGPTLASTEGTKRHRRGVPQYGVAARPAVAPVPERPGARAPDRGGRPGGPPSPEVRRPSNQPRPGDSRGPARRDDDRSGRRRPMRFPVTQGTPAGGYDRLALAPVTPRGDRPAVPPVVVRPGPVADGPDGAGRDEAGATSGTSAPSDPSEARHGGSPAPSVVDAPHDVAPEPTNRSPGPTRGAPEGERGASSPVVDDAGGANRAEVTAIPDPGPVSGRPPGGDRRDPGPGPTPPQPASDPGTEPHPEPGPIPQPGPVPGPEPHPGPGPIPEPGPVPSPDAIPDRGPLPGGEGTGIPGPGLRPGGEGREAAHLARSRGKATRRDRRRGGAKHLARVKDRVVAEMLTPAPAPAAPPAPDVPGGDALAPAGSIRGRLARDLLVPASAAPAEAPPATLADAPTGAHGPPAPPGPGPAARIAGRAGRWRESVARRREARRTAAEAAAAAAAIPPPPVIVDHPAGAEAPTGVAAVPAPSEGVDPPRPWAGRGVDTAGHDGYDLDERDDSDADADTDTDLVPVRADDGLTPEGLAHEGVDTSPAGTVTGRPARRRDGVPVRLPVPVTTRLWALVRLVAFVTVLGLAVGGALVALVVAVASALLS